MFQQLTVSAVLAASMQRAGRRGKKYDQCTGLKVRYIGVRGSALSVRSEGVTNRYIRGLGGQC